MTSLTVRMIDIIGEDKRKMLSYTHRTDSKKRQADRQTGRKNYLKLLLLGIMVGAFFFESFLKNIPGSLCFLDIGSKN